MAEISKRIGPQVLLNNLCNLWYKWKFRKDSGTEKEICLFQVQMETNLIMNLIHNIFLLTITKPAKETT